MNERLNISDLAVLLAEYTGKNKKETELFLKELLVVISDALLDEQIVKVKGLGTFKVVSVEERESIHVNTGERFVIPAHSKFSFIPDKELKELVNKPFAFFETTELNEGVVFPEEKEEEPEEEPQEEDVEEIVEPEQTKINEPELQQSDPEKIDPAEPKEEAPAAVQDVQPSPSSGKQKGMFVFVALFSLVCIIGGLYFFNFDSKKTNNIKDIKQENITAIESEPVSPEESSAIISDSTMTTEPETVDTVKAEPKEPVIVKIVPDTRLTLIALEHYGHKAFWVYIYEHNKAIITNPNNIQMGTELVVPDPALYGIDAKNPESVAKAKAKQVELNAKFN